MNKSQVRILIVDDDQTFGATLMELFQRGGMISELALSADQAISMTEHFEYHVLIIDCMMPKMNGVDLAQSLMARLDPKPQLFLMSGVFKDKSFAKEALVKTGASHFLHKPFHLEKLQALVEAAMQPQLDSELDVIPQLLTLEDPSSNDVVEGFAKQNTLHGFHLPLIYALFSRSGLTGELNLVSTEQEIAQITLIDGKIVDVRSQSKATQIGELLIEFGFAMPEDVEEALKDSSTPDPLGKRLVNAGALSPHAIGLIREEQLATRLSAMIQNTSIEVHWLKKPLDMKDTFHALPLTRLQNIMADWIFSKIPAEFLRSFYIQYSDYSIHWRGGNDYRIEGAKVNLMYLPHLIKRIEQNPTVQQLLVEAGESDLACLQAIHALVLERRVYFKLKKQTGDDFAAKLVRYKKLLQSFAEKDFFQILGISQNAKPSEISRAYLELAKVFHPDKVPRDAPEELKMLCHNIFSHVTQAHLTVSDENNRKAYLVEMSRKEAGRIMELEPLYQQAIDALKLKKYPVAAKMFDDLIAKKLDFPDLLSYSIWARIKSGQRVNESDFSRVPPELRHSAVFLMAKGLHVKQKQNWQQALELLQSARYLDHSLPHLMNEISKVLEEINKAKAESTFFGRIMGKGKKSA